MINTDYASSLSDESLIRRPPSPHDGLYLCFLTTAERCWCSWLSSQVNESSQLPAAVFPSDKILPK